MIAAKRMRALDRPGLQSRHTAAKSMRALAPEICSLPLSPRKLTLPATSASEPVLSEAEWMPQHTFSPALVSLKGTALAVPQRTFPTHGALAPEVNLAEGHHGW